jgi:hypothetical protein
MKKSSLTPKELIGLAKLTVSQARKSLDHENYKLRGCNAIILYDSPIDERKFHGMALGKLTDISEDGYVSIGENSSIKLGPKSVLVIYKDDMPTYAVLHE